MRHDTYDEGEEIVLNVTNDINSDTFEEVSPPDTPIKQAVSQANSLRAARKVKLSSRRSSPMGSSSNMTSQRNSNHESGSDDQVLNLPSPLLNSQVCFI